MNRCVYPPIAAGLLLMLLVLSELQAAEQPAARPRFGTSTVIGDCCWNADDYCRKPTPCIPCAPWTCDPECYGRKPLPNLPCPAGCVTCDDYVRKCFPRPPWQCAVTGIPPKLYTTTNRQPPTTIRNPGVWFK